MNPKRIHILCLKPEICTLIRKALTSAKYRVTCSGRDEINVESIDNFNEQIDCLILDKDIEVKLKEKIKIKFENVSIVCLPSLESENNNKEGIKNMSEPFKLSELFGHINSIFKNE